MDKKINLGGLPFTIAFSGGCCSGKTSTMQALKYILEQQGYKVVILDEVIRKTKEAEHHFNSIISLRKNAASYFRLQEKIIKQKIEQEKEAYNSKEPIIYLFDRALTDSLFYFEFYVDKVGLHDRKPGYFTFHRWLYREVMDSMYHLDMLVEFKPLLKVADSNRDTMRPNYLDMASYSEFLGIHRNNIALFYDLLDRTPRKAYLQFDLSTVDGNNCIEAIIDKIEELCIQQKR